MRICLPSIMQCGSLSSYEVCEDLAFKLHNAKKTQLKKYFPTSESHFLNPRGPLWVHFLTPKWCPNLLKFSQEAPRRPRIPAKRPREGHSVGSIAYTTQNDTQGGTVFNVKLGGRDRRIRRRFLLPNTWLVSSCRSANFWFSLMSIFIVMEAS